MRDEPIATPAGLSQAEAERTGVVLEYVEDEYSRPLAHVEDDKPKLVACRQLMRRTVQMHGAALSALPGGDRLVEELERLSG
jgi:hypothetical protein